VIGMDVIVVGAGLAGPTCARRVLEAGDAVRGRARTDVVDGCRLERGFRVLTAFR
jgi:flavin-dependent dehydrogenase